MKVSKESLIVTENDFTYSSSKNIDLIQVQYIVEYVRNNCEHKEEKYNVIITPCNYKKIISDLEIRYFFENNFISETYNIRKDLIFIFLAPISRQGYNFGQYRIGSHLIKIGINRKKIILCPVYIHNGRYVLNRHKLTEILDKYKNNLIYIFETVYIGWEKGMYKINQFIKKNSSAVICAGGPLTSSHLDYCIQELNADIIFTGHGEYIIENYLKEATKQSTIYPKLDFTGAYYGDSAVSTDEIPFVIKHMDYLYWDLPLLKKFCELSSIINLFTSEECHGNCIFCYRKSNYIGNHMSNDELLLRIKQISSMSDLLENEKNVYIRFFDDDFLAGETRDENFVNLLPEALGKNLKLIELTVSVRSISKLMKKSTDGILESLRCLKLKRIVIGVDGYNDKDLKYLRKGYNFDTVLELLDKLSLNGFSVLCYAILTTIDTNFMDLFSTLKNMLRIILKPGIYIGPTITPAIYVHSNNIKLYTSIRKKENFIFTEIDSLQFDGKKKEDITDNVMSAKILPKDTIVRNVLDIIEEPTVKESAYVLPIVCAYFYSLAKEMNFLLHCLNNKSILKSLKIYKRKYKKKIDIYNKIKTENKTKKQLLVYYNLYNRDLRKLHDIEYKISIVKDKNKIYEKINNIHDIIKDYMQFANGIMDSWNHNKTNELKDRIYRLIYLPIISYKKTICNKEQNWIEQQKLSIKNIDFLDKDIEVFQRIGKKINILL